MEVYQLSFSQTIGKSAKFYSIKIFFIDTVRRCYLPRKYKNLVFFMFVLMCPHRKKSNGFKSGELGAHEIGLPLPIHRSLNFCSATRECLLKDKIRVWVDVGEGVWLTSTHTLILSFKSHSLVAGQKFNDRWIGRGGPISWAPRSPNLKPLDFFLWGHIKTDIYKTRIKDLDDLKTRITQEIQRPMKAWYVGIDRFR